VDLGAGDGQFVLAHAGQHPNQFVLGVDASSDAMREASHRAARPRTELPNARFAVSSLETLPLELTGRFDLVTVHFPWGSLWHAATACDSLHAERLAALVRGGGELRFLLSHAERDEMPAVDPSDVVLGCANHGLTPIEVRPAALEDAVAAHSSWGKRLLAGGTGSRSAWLIRLNRPAADSATRD
jgi:hypothetical protein